MKTCSRCKVSKNESEFHRHRKSRDGLQHFCKSCGSVYAKKYNTVNKERRKLHALEYRKTHRDALNIQKAEYFKANRDKIIARRKRRRNNNPLCRLMHRLRSLTSRIPQRTGSRKRNNTLAILGAEPQAILDYLGGDAPDGFHIDHICPLSQAKTEEELYKLGHYTNLQYLSPEENMQKGNRYTEQGNQKCIELLGRPWDHSEEKTNELV